MDHTALTHLHYVQENMKTAAVQLASHVLLWVSKSGDIFFLLEIIVGTTTNTDYLVQNKFWSLTGIAHIDTGVIEK